MPCHLRTSSWNQQLWGLKLQVQAGKYKQGSPLLDRTAFQTSLQKHQVPICLFQKWECVLWVCYHQSSACGNAPALFQSHKQTRSFAMTLDSKQNPTVLFLTNTFNRLSRLLSKVANHFELLVASTNDTLYWQDPLYSSKRRKCNFLSTRKTRSQVLSRWSNF